MSADLKVVPPKRNLDAKFINPFLVSVIETLKTQCQQQARPGTAVRREQLSVGKDEYAICASLGLIDKGFTGVLSLCFPEKTFLGVMSSMLGEPFTEITTDLEDGAGELLNIIYGGAKRQLNADGYSLEKAIPSIARGEKIKMHSLSDGPVLVLPFDCEAGWFHVEIALG